MFFSKKNIMMVLSIFITNWCMEYNVSQKKLPSITQLPLEIGKIIVGYCNLIEPQAKIWYHKQANGSSWEYFLVREYSNTNKGKFFCRHINIYHNKVLIDVLHGGDGAFYSIGFSTYGNLFWVTNWNWKNHLYCLNIYTINNNEISFLKSYERLGNENLFNLASDGKTAASLSPDRKTVYLLNLNTEKKECLNMNKTVTGLLFNKYSNKLAIRCWDDTISYYEVLQDDEHGDISFGKQLTTDLSLSEYFRKKLICKEWPPTYANKKSCNVL